MINNFHFLITTNNFRWESCFFKTQPILENLSKSDIAYGNRCIVQYCTFRTTPAAHTGTFDFRPIKLGGSRTSPGTHTGSTHGSVSAFPGLPHSLAPLASQQFNFKHLLLGRLILRSLPTRGGVCDLLRRRSPSSKSGSPFAFQSMPHPCLAALAT